MATQWWERLFVTYSVGDVAFARDHALDPQVLLEVSGADRIGDLNPANVSSFGYVPHTWIERLGSGHEWDLGFAHDLRGALERRQWLWLAELDVEDLPEVQRRAGHGLVRQAGPEHDGRVPVAVNPCALARAWLAGSDEQRHFMRWATKGTDTMRVSRHDLRALREAEVDVVERPSVLRFLRSPKVIAYLIVLIYSSLRALPVMFVKEFHGNVWIIWVIDVLTAIPYTWGIIAMVAARHAHTRLLGVVVALATFVAPYVYFWTHGRGYPWFVTLIVVGMIAAAVALEGWRWLRDRLVVRRLRGAGEVA